MQDSVTSGASPAGTRALSVNAALRQEQLECKKQLNRERRRRDESEDVKKLREEKEKCVAAVWSEE